MLEISRRVTPRTCSVLRLHFRSAYHPRDTGDLLTLLKMRFQEPQLLVEWPAYRLASEMGPRGDLISSIGSIRRIGDL